MRAVDARIACTLAVALGVSGCAINPAPKEWRRSAEASQTGTRGSWIVIQAKVQRGPRVQGEMIAIDETAFHVLTTSGLTSVPRDSVKQITVVAYGTPAGSLTAWGWLGAVSTWSHGSFLVITLPMWAIAGLAASNTEGHAGISHNAEFARRFARFPQGLPPDFDPGTLGPLKAQPMPTDTRPAPLRR